jgi:hypothetical protein
MADRQQRDAVAEIIDNPEIQPWDRLPKETLKAFQAFTIFRSQDKRGLTPVAKELKCTVQNVQRWATKYDWAERSRQWDIFNDRIAQQEEVRERIAMRKRFVQQGVTMQKLGVIGLNELTEIVNIGGKLRMTPGEITNLIKTGTEIEKLGRGDVAQTGNVIFEIQIGDVDEAAMKGH